MTTILIKKRDTTGAPAPGDLTNAAGGTEIAVNTTDLKVYTKNSGGSIVQIGSGPSATDTLTNKTISGANNTLSNIANSSLTNSSITFGSTAQALGSTVSALNGVSIGATTASTGAFTNLAYTGTLTGGTGVINIGSGQLYKDASGNVGIGTSSPTHPLTIQASASPIVQVGDGVRHVQVRGGSTTQNPAIGTYYAGDFTLATNSEERMRIDSAGNVGIGTSAPNAVLHARGANSVGAGVRALKGWIGGAGSWGNGGTEELGIGYSGIRSIYAGSGDNWHLSFTTGTSSQFTAGTQAERMRIDFSGNVLVGTTSGSPAASNVAGFAVAPSGQTQISQGLTDVLVVNRIGNDGVLVSFRQDGTVEGTISVSGTTVSYNAFAGSHWSQLSDGSKPEILRGTVLESINELVEWPDEPRTERLPKCKISDTAGSKKVYGVFMGWDNDWTSTNDMYVTALGAFVCRVNADVVVELGDLLESNGDGTARVQSDDIIRSSTIGKVTSSVKTHEYDDGSYCVPTVLYCG
jgi:hypothetical protein